jgi:hypothetical protein
MADGDNECSPENPSCGQCDITSLVVHDLLGGDLLGADVHLDGERVEAHMWNRLPTGIEVDLTREQFRRGEVVAEPVVRLRTPAIADPSHPRYHRYEQYLVLCPVATRPHAPGAAAAPDRPIGRGITR